MISDNPNRGDIWYADLDPAIGHEQAGVRPVLIVSSDLFNHGPAGLVIILPLTSKKRNIPARITVSPPEGGLKVASYIECDQIRSISKQRLLQKWEKVTQEILDEVDVWLKTFLEL